MKSHKDEITLIYDSNTNVDKQVLAYAKSISNHVKELDYCKNNVSPTQWRGILNLLDLRPKDLLNRADPYYQTHIRGRSFNQEGWLNILARNPSLIKAPIAIKGKKAVLLNNPTDVLQLK